MKIYMLLAALFLCSCTEFSDKEIKGELKLTHPGFDQYVQMKDEQTGKLILLRSGKKMIKMDHDPMSVNDGLDIGKMSIGIYTVNGVREASITAYGKDIKKISDDHYKIKLTPRYSFDLDFKRVYKTLSIYRPTYGSYGYECDHPSGKAGVTGKIWRAKYYRYDFEIKLASYSADFASFSAKGEERESTQIQDISDCRLKKEVF